MSEINKTGICEKYDGLRLNCDSINLAGLSKLQYSANLGSHSRVLRTEPYRTCSNVSDSQS